MYCETLPINAKLDMIYFFGCNITEQSNIYQRSLSKVLNTTT